MGYFEQRFHTVCEYVIRNHKIPDNVTSKLDLLQFVIVQLERTKFAADDMNKTFREIAKRKIKSSNSSRLEMDKDEMLRLTDLAEQAVPNYFPLSMADDELPFLFDLRPTLFVIEDDLEFVTSDSPIVSYNYLARYTKYERNASQVGHRGIILMVPLSPKVCLAYYDPVCYSFKSIFYIKNGNYVKVLNRLIIENSYKQIFFSQNMSKSQYSSLIKFNKKTKTRGLTVFDGNYYYEDFIRELIHIPGLNLTKYGKSFPHLPRKINWPHRMENKAISSFISKLKK